MRMIRMIALVLLSLAALSLSAQQESGDMRLVNVHVFKVKDVNAEVLRSFKKEDQIVHLASEGSLIKLFTQTSYDENAVRELLSTAVTREEDIVWISSSQESKNSRLFKK